MPSFYSAAPGSRHGHSSGGPDFLQHTHTSHYQPYPPISDSQQYGFNSGSIAGVGHGSSTGNTNSNSSANSYSNFPSLMSQELGPLQPDPFVQYKSSTGPANSLYNHGSIYGAHNGPSVASALSQSSIPPMLPPLRMDERFSLDPRLDTSQSRSSAAATGHTSRRHGVQTGPSHGRHQQQQANIKEEKVVGGVSAKLDYQMEQMTDFVTEMTVGMYDLLASRIHIADIDIVRSVKPAAQNPPTFRKWVLQVLNATRLPSATILLSLSYLTIRVRDLSQARRFHPTERSLYQMLTVALILGSKFLDDNTFQNKSWAQVSNIPVSELNADEREWLQSFGHRLHHDPARADGFSSWEEKWASYKTRQSLRSQVATTLHPIDTTLRSQRPLHAQALSPSYYQQQSQPPPSAPQQPQQHLSRFVRTSPSFGLDLPELGSSQPYTGQQYSPYHPWFGQQQQQQQHSAIERSPSTAPHTGPPTPDYYAARNVWNTFDLYGSGLHHPPAQHQQPHHAPQYYPSLQSQPSNGLHSAYPTTHSYAPNVANIWNCHGSACQCSSCRNSNLMQPRFGPIVVG